MPYTWLLLLSFSRTFREERILSLFLIYVSSKVFMSDENCRSLSVISSKSLSMHREKSQFQRGELTFLKCL